MKKEFLSLGMMTGTSMDGIDASIIETDGYDKTIHIMGDSIDFSRELKIQLREAEQAVQISNGKNYDKNLAKLLTEHHAVLANNLIKKSGLEIDLIGFHGQTLYHAPNQGITLQIGDGRLLAQLTGVKVVNNFRQADIDNGGQGAPLAPLYHKVLAKNVNLFPAAIVNCGGISNISYVDEDSAVGFDTGPGNVLLDRYIRNKTDNAEFMDYNAKYSSKGEVNQDVLKDLILNSLQFEGFWEKAPPKSLDSNNFLLPLSLDKISICDAAATLAFFTSWSIVQGAKFIPAVNNWVLVGGGWSNPTILKYFKQLLLQEGLGQDILEFDRKSKFIEAEIFAYLAVRRFLSLPTSYPCYTGCRFPTVGGDLYVP